MHICNPTVTHTVNPLGTGRYNVCMVGALLLLCTAFNDDSNLAWSLLLNLFTRYIRDDKNNGLNIFLLSGSIQFSLHFILKQIMRLF